MLQWEEWNHNKQHFLPQNFLELSKNNYLYENQIFLWPKNAQKHKIFLGLNK